MKKQPLYVFVFLFSIYLLTSGGHTYAPDDESMVHVMDSIFMRGEFDQPPPGTAVTVGTAEAPDGRYYAQSGIAQPLLAMPLYVLGRILAQQYDPRFSDYLTRLVVVFFNVLVSSCLALVLYAFARGLGYAVPIATGLTLVFALATNAWSEAKSLFNEPLMSLFLLLAFYAVFLARRDKKEIWLVLAGLAWGASFATKLHAILALAALLLYVAWGAPLSLIVRGLITRERDTLPAQAVLKRLLFFGLGALVTVGTGVLLYNYLRFGNPFETGYGEELQPILIWEGLFGLLFSSGKSIFLFAPPILLAFPAFRRFIALHRPEAIVWSVYILTTLLFHANFSDWHSRGAWGNRYLYFTLPYWILPIGALLIQPLSRMSRMLTVGLVSAGLLVQLVMVPINFDMYLNIQRNEAKRLFDPASSPILANTILLEQNVRTWWHQTTAHTPGVVLGEGWLTPLGNKEELFPRFIAQRGTLLIRADPNAPLYVTLLVADYRATEQPKRTLRVVNHDSEIPIGVMQNPGKAEMRVTFTIPAPHAADVGLTLETLGSDPSGDSPMGDELGFQVQDVIVSAGTEQLDFYPDLSIPPIPVANPFASFGWFFNPDLHHWDFWWWYLYFSGIDPAQTLAWAAPLVTIAFCSFLASGVFLTRNLLAAGSRQQPHVKVE